MPLPPLMPPPRAVRRLTMENQQPELPLQRSPSPGRAASPVIEEAPALPMVYFSQFRMEAYERQNEPLHQKVGGWLRDLQAAYASDGPPPYPTPPSAPRKDQYVSDSDSEYGRDVLAPPAIAATYSHQERGPVRAQGLRGPASSLLLDRKSVV